MSTDLCFVRQWGVSVRLFTLLTFALLFSGSTATVLIAQTNDEEVTGVFFASDLVDLEFPDGGLTSEIGHDLRTIPPDMTWVFAQAHLDATEAEAFFAPAWMRSGVSRIACTLPQAQTVEGMLNIPSSDGIKQLRFRIPKEAWVTRESPVYQDFLRTSAQYFDYLSQRALPGTAWFRHRSRIFASKLTPKESKVTKPLTGLLQLLNYPNGEYRCEALDLTYAREFRVSDLRPIEDVKPYKLPAVDWTDLAQVEADQLDALASWIPSDQFALFLDSFQSLVDTVDYASQELPQPSMLTPRLPTRETTRIYQRQLGLQLTKLSRLLGPQLIESLAISGSDPFLSQGSDLTILFEPKPGKTDILRGLLETQIGLESEAREGTESHLEINGVECLQFKTEDESLRATLGVVDGMIVVSNTNSQLERVIDTRAKQLPCLSEQTEYQVFRGNYPLAPEQTGLLVVSSAAMQRWISPSYRISELRLWTAQSALFDLKAAELYAEFHDAPFDLEVSSEPYRELLGEVTKEGQGIRSEHFGSLRTPKPYSERIVKAVTKAESQAYLKWEISRNKQTNYQYSPFVVQFRASEKKWQAECSFYPRRKRDLLEDLFYSFLLDTQINVERCDPHAESMLHFSIAYNRDSQAAQFLRSSLEGLDPEIRNIDLATWFGNNVSIYIDDGPFWDKNIRENYEWPKKDMPVALRWQLAEQADIVILTELVLRLIRVGANPEDSQTHTHDGVNYFELDLPNNFWLGDQGPLFLLISDEQILLTPSEPLLKRAIERETTLLPANSKLLDIERWPGRSLNLQLGGRFAQTISDGNSYEMTKQAQLPIPILNEWHRLAPDSPPHQTHLTRWGEPLQRKNRFQWNEKLGTMESKLVPTTKDGQKTELNSAFFSDIEAASVGVDFEQESIQIRIRITRN